MLGFRLDADHARDAFELQALADVGVKLRDSSLIPAATTLMRSMS